MFAGINTFQNGIKNNAFSLSINARHRTTAGQLFDVFWTMARGVQTYSTVIRRTLETCDSYDEALEFLQSQKIIGGCFYILAGTQHGEGAIIAKYGDTVDNI